MPAFLRPLFRLARRLESARCTRLGRRRLARGDVGGALSALRRALFLRPNAFRALLHLSRAYLRQRDFALAWKTLLHARKADAARFERETPRWLAREGYDLERLGRIAVPLRAASAAAAASTAEPRSRRRSGGADLRYGDCRDLDEYARFRAMPPIGRQEVEGTDWDGVMRDLLDDLPEA